MSLNEDSTNSVFAPPASEKVAPDGTGKVDQMNRNWV